MVFVVVTVVVIITALQSLDPYEDNDVKDVDPFPSLIQHHNVVSERSRYLYLSLVVHSYQYVHMPILFGLNRQDILSKFKDRNYHLVKLSNFNLSLFTYLINVLLPINLLHIKHKLHYFYKEKVFYIIDYDEAAHNPIISFINEVVIFIGY